MTDLDLMLRFMLQVMIVLAACKAVGWIGSKYLGQTQVVMEMVTGVLLGPSVLGRSMPELQGYLFPRKLEGLTGSHPSMSILYIIAQIGLVLYMFLIGLEFDIKLISNRIGGAVSVSLAGIIAPFALGFGIAYMYRERTDLFAPAITDTNAAIYLGAAMCITAFPMLARILYERGIARTSMGTLALGAGATDDAAAWCLLAMVLAFSKGNMSIAWLAIGGGILFGVLMLTLGKKLLNRLAVSTNETGKFSQGQMTTVILILMAGAWFTDAIGIYAVFGAFLVGCAMPRGRYAEAIRERIEPMTVSFLLPFFFVYSGLNTNINLISGTELWTVTIVICLAAIFGKGVACALAARASGEPWRESWTIGTLMNARGLMELIILNIGLQQGVITPTLFAIMVVMAIVTTLMASPLFLLIYGKVEPGTAPATA